MSGINAGKKENAMRVLISATAALLTIVPEVMASGGGDQEPLSFLAIAFIGFGALILVFQIFPSVVLLLGIIKGILAPAVKKDETEAVSDE